MSIQINTNSTFSFFFGLRKWCVVVSENPNRKCFYMMPDNSQIYIQISRKNVIVIRLMFPIWQKKTTTTRNWKSFRSASVSESNNCRTYFEFQFDDDKMLHSNIRNIKDASCWMTIQMKSLAPTMLQSHQKKRHLYYIHRNKAHRRKRIAGIMRNILHINIHYDCHFEQIHKSFPEWVCRMCVYFAFRLCDFTLTYIPFNFIRSRQTTEISGFKFSFFFFLLLFGNVVISAVSFSTDIWLLSLRNAMHHVIGRRSKASLMWRSGMNEWNLGAHGENVSKPISISFAQ